MGGQGSRSTVNQEEGRPPKIWSFEDSSLSATAFEGTLLQNVTGDLLPLVAFYAPLRPRYGTLKKIPRYKYKSTWSDKVAPEHQMPWKECFIQLSPKAEIIVVRSSFYYFKPDGTFIRKITARFPVHTPNQVAIQPSTANIFIMGSKEIEVMNDQGVSLRILGEGRTGPKAVINSARCISFDLEENLIISDPGEHKIHFWTPDGEFIRSMRVLPIYSISDICASHWSLMWYDRSTGHLQRCPSESSRSPGFSLEGWPCVPAGKMYPGQHIIMVSEQGGSLISGHPKTFAPIYVHDKNDEFMMEIGNQKNKKQTAGDFELGNFVLDLQGDLWIVDTQGKGKIVIWG